MTLSLRSEEHTSELQSLTNLVCRLLLEKKNIKNDAHKPITRIGSLIMNPGGHGGSEIQYGRSADSMVSTSMEKLDDFFFFFNDTATTEIYTLSLHDALPI